MCSKSVGMPTILFKVTALKHRVAEFSKSGKKLLFHVLPRDVLHKQKMGEFIEERKLRASKVGMFTSNLPRTVRETIGQTGATSLVGVPSVGRQGELSMSN